MLFFKWYILSLGAILAFLAMDYSFTLFGVPPTLLFLLESMEHLGRRMVAADYIVVMAFGGYRF